ncbi:MAG: cobalamin-binding protein [Candidatus Kapaibacterium sp.]
MSTHTITHPRIGGFHLLIGGMLGLLLAGGCNRREPSPPSAQTDSSGAIRLTDVMGGRLVLNGPARKVISLAPNLTEIVYALGAGDRLIGRTSFCNYPPEALQLPPVADMLSINFEKIIGLKPDLILMTKVGNTNGNYDKLRDLKLPAYVMRQDSVAQTLTTIDTIGILLGKVTQARQMTSALRKTIDSITALAKQGEKVSTFIVIDKSPLITASRGFLAEEIELAGGRNIAAGATENYPKYNREELLLQNPDVILMPGTSWDAVPALLADYPEWKDLKAVKGNRVYIIPLDIAIRPGPRIGQGMKAIYEALHGAEPKALLKKYGADIVPGSGM